MYYERPWWTTENSAELWCHLGVNVSILYLDLRRLRVRPFKKSALSLEWRQDPLKKCAQDKYSWRQRTICDVSQRKQRLLVFELHLTTWLLKLSIELSIRCIINLMNSLRASKSQKRFTYIHFNPYGQHWYTWYFIRREYVILSDEKSSFNLEKNEVKLTSHSFYIHCK